jgi:hypothetical protein
LECGAAYSGAVNNAAVRGRHATARLVVVDPVRSCIPTCSKVL